MKHGIEDGWGAGCRTTVKLPSGKTVLLLNSDDFYHVLNRSPGQALQVHVREVEGSGHGVGRCHRQGWV